MVTWMIFSFGPDNTQWIWADNPHYDSGRDVRNYAPTNGTKSRGSIYYWGGDGHWIGIATPIADPAQAKTAPHPGLTIDGMTIFNRLPPNT